MSVLDNERHELFAQNVAEGRSLRESYVLAGYETENDNSTDACASRLLSDAKVKARVVELQSAAAEKTLVTVESLTLELEAARVLAMADDKGAGAAVSAVMGKAKLHGLGSEKLVVNLHEQALDQLK